METTTATQKHDKVGFVKESCTSNGGSRTVIEGSFAPDAMAPMHYHTEFNESFEVLEGELSVWNDGKKTILKPGDKATVQKRILHRFKNESGSYAKVLVTTEPGYEPFEQNIQIMMGLQRDGVLDQLSKMTPKMVPVGMVLMELSNTNLVGPTKVMLNLMSLFISKKKTALRKAELLKKYCS